MSDDPTIRAALHIAAFTARQIDLDYREERAEIAKRVAVCRQFSPTIIDARVALTVRRRDALSDNRLPWRILQMYGGNGLGFRRSMD